MPDRPLILGVAPVLPGPAPAAAAWEDAARAARDAGADLLVVEHDGLDAPLVAARIAAAVDRIGILAGASPTTTEPFHLSTQVATIDVIGRGRGGWLATVADRAQAQGAVTWAVPEDVVGDADEHLRIVAALWESWEPDAEIRDVATGRFLDRDRIHRIDVRGRHIAVRGPSITPRPPQGRPVVAVRAVDAATLALADARGDLAIVAPAADLPAPTAGAAARLVELDADRLLAADADPARAALVGPPAAGDGRPVARLADAIAAHREAGAAGVLLRSSDASSLGPLVEELVRRNLRAVAPAAGATLRERLGLPPAEGARLAPSDDDAPGPAGRPASRATGRTGGDRRDRRQVRLGAHFPGVNNTTVWSDPASGSHIAFDSFLELARTAERARFDFLFLAEGLSLREHAGELHDLDVAGRPEGLALLAALSAATERLGLAATLTTTYHEPLEVARQVATLDHLSGGRAAWNLVTSTDAVSGANVRRGAYLAYEDRYVRAREALGLADRLWRDGPGPFAVDGEQVTLRGHWSLPTPPQGRPVILQAGDSDAGREFAAAHADAIFTRHAGIADGRAFVADVKGRLARHGRRPEELLVLPGATFVLGDSERDARERAEHVRYQQVSGPTARVFAEQLWNRDLSAYDPEGPLPDVDPVEGEITIAPGSIPARAFAGRRHQVVAELRELAARERLSLRDVMVRTRARHSFVGTPEAVAEEIDRHVQEGACDGFILVPHITPGGLSEFADRVVPLLQERGSLRAEYAGTTLRDHLGLPPWRSR